MDDILQVYVVSLVFIGNILITPGHCQAWHYSDHLPVPRRGGIIPSACTCEKPWFEFHRTCLGYVYVHMERGMGQHCTS